jgi:hypothetical protein
MRRILIALLVLGLLLIPSAALAGQYKVFDLGTGLEIPKTDPAGFARVFGDVTKASGACDRFDWTTAITTKATVAQWINWSIEALDWSWQIRKPGVFASDGNRIVVSSNDDVNITFQGFTDLVSQSHPGAPDIDAAYGWDVGVDYGVPGTTMPVGAPASGWKDAPVNETFQVPYATLVAAGSAGYPVRLWNKVTITDFTRACSYLGTGNIVLSVTDQKCFIDGDTGLFK